MPDTLDAWMTANPTVLPSTVAGPKNGLIARNGAGSMFEIGTAFACAIAVVFVAIAPFAF